MMSETAAMPLSFEASELPCPGDSSAQGATEVMPVLHELELDLCLLGRIFDRWMVHCMAAAGVPDLSPVDVLVLQAVNRRGRPTRLAEICLMLNIEESHLVAYATRKLCNLGVIAVARGAKEKAVVMTPKGAAVCACYRDVREALLVRSLRTASPDEARLSEAAAIMRVLSGHYDQAARSAARF
jgi:predicted MarR family transcription regulator